MSNRNEVVDKLGNRQQTGKSDPLTQQFAAEFTRNFEMLAERYPVYQELRNVFDLAVISMLIKSQELDRKVDWNPEFYTQSYGYQSVRAREVTSVKSVVSYRITKERVVLAAVSGGVVVDPLLKEIHKSGFDHHRFLQAEPQIPTFLFYSGTL